MTKLNSTLTLKGTTYVTSYETNSVLVVDLATQKVTNTIKVGTYPFCTISSLDGKTVYVSNSSSNSVSVIDVDSETITHTVFVGQRPRSLAIHPDEKQIYVGNISDSSVSVINIATNTIVSTILIDNVIGVNEIAFNTDGTRLYVGSYPSGIVKAINTKDHSVIGSAVTFGPNKAMGIVVNPLDQNVIVANQGTFGGHGNTISVIDANSLSVVKTIEVGIRPSSVYVTGNGKKIYVVNIDSGTLSVIDGITYEIITTIKVGDAPSNAWISSDGKLICVANHDSRNISVVDVDLNEVIETITINDSPYGIAMLPIIKKTSIVLSTVTSPTQNPLLAVVFGDGKFVITGINGETLYSNDGLNWVMNKPLKYYSHLSVQGIIYGEDKFIGVGYSSGTNLPNVFSSLDGMDWNDCDIVGLYESIIWGNGLFIAVGGYSNPDATGAYIASSSDGSNWSVVKDTLGSFLSGITYGNGKFVTVGDKHSRTSTDGENWEIHNIDIKSYLKDICWSESNKIFVAIGTLGSIMTSPDGIVWTSQSSGTLIFLEAICWSEGVQEFVVVGGNGIVLTSPDGLVWTEQDSPVTSILFGVGVSKGQFIAVGKGGVIVQILINKE